jgi:GTP-binding protein
MLDVLVAKVRELGLDSRPIPEPDLKMVLIGRPNVGKSSLLNALAGEDRVIVSEVRHTTREPQDTMMTFVDEDGDEKNILIMDTVGIRKKSRVTRGIEYIGVGKSFQEMREADIALLMLDASEGVGSQDKKLIGLIDRSKVGIIVLANKWDIAEDDRLGDAEEFRRHLNMTLPFCSWAPVAYISALSGRNVDKIVPMALRVMKERQKRLTPEQLDEFLVKMKKIHGHAFKEGPNRPKVYGINQSATEPPQFELVVRKKEVVHPNFLRFVENRLRDEFGFEGTPIRVEARQISRGKQI